jgi:hypothetical protein
MKRPKHVVVETNYIKTPYQYKPYELYLILTSPILVKTAAGVYWELEAFGQQEDESRPPPS